MKVTIKNPCHESWDKMNPTEKGRFCSSCKTEVIDFTKMTKSEIKAYFVNSKSEICVRIEDDKLYNEKKLGLRMRPIWVAAASMFVFSKVGITQGRAYVIPEATKGKTQYQISTLNKRYKSINIEFQIIDLKTKKGIPFAEIRFIDLDLHIKTDKNGNCHAEIPNISEGVDIEINSIKHTLIISAHKNLHYIFAIDDEELSLVKRIESDRTISFDNAKNKDVLEFIKIGGVILDVKTKAPVPNTKVYIYNDSLEEDFSTKTDSLGRYEIEIPKNKDILHEIYVRRSPFETIEFFAKGDMVYNFSISNSKRRYITIGCPSF